MSFVQRKIDITFQLGEGQFGTDGSNTVKLAGLRVSSHVIKAGGPSMGTAQLTVYGMALELMNRLSTLGMVITLVRKNTVTIDAGDVGGTPATVFIGTITNAWADFNAAPQVAFHVEAHAGLIEAVTPLPPSSFPGQADVATIMSGLATKAGLAFENNGVNVRLSNQYLSGSARDQIMACAKAAPIEWVIDNGKLAIWPPGAARGGTVGTVSGATGMVGYPSYTSKGVMVKTRFNPSIGYGNKILVQSDLTPANGEWVVFGLEHRLDAQVIKGQWFSEVNACRPGLMVVS